MDAEKERLFWQRFHQKTIACHVPPPERPWYRRHAERYITAHSELRLAAHTPDTVSKYIDDLGRHGQLRDGQFQQAVEALSTIRGQPFTEEKARVNAARSHFFRH